MTRTTLSSTLITATLLIWASLCASADNKSTSGTATKSISAASAPNKSVKLKLVDLNHASKRELKSLPGISDAMANKIIAGRPYNSKAAIVTDGIVPAGVFLVIKARIEVR